ncbi:MAG: AGCS family amino acid carrier protein [Chlamydiales bacterium]
MSFNLFSLLELIRDNLWGYIGFPAIILLGLFFTFKSKVIQIRKFPKVTKTFFSLLTTPSHHEKGIHPIGAFFTCLGGCVGIGNVVAICGAVKIGGPGALFWVWITAFLGMVLKYSEVFLGLRYRVIDACGNYDGGPMYFLQRVFKTLWIPNLLALLLCIYGVEIYQFTVITSTVSINFGLNYFLVTLLLLGLVIFTASGGIQRVSHVSSVVVPLFIVAYLGMGLWVIGNNITLIPEVLKLIVSSAFTGHAAIGGFAGSTLLIAASQGIAQGCYTTDVGVGYASIIHSESSTIRPQKQACLTIFDIFLDTFVICTVSILLILITGVWDLPIDESLMVQTSLAKYFPYMHYFMPFFLFLLGYSTIIAYFFVGLKCAQFLSPQRGKYYFYAYAVFALLIFSFAETRQTFLLMSFVGVLLLFINLYGFYRLRDEISFELNF